MALAALMLIVALAFVLVPLLRGRRSTDPQLETRRKLKALEQARADGVLTADEYAAKRAEFGAELRADSDLRTPRSRASLVAAIAVVLLLPMAAIVLYREIGAPQALDPANLVARADDQGDHTANLEAAIAQLAEKMKQEPNNTEGWILLGRAYKSARRFAEARDALKHAHDLAPDDADLMVDYAEALIFAGTDRHIQGEALALIEQAIRKVSGSPVSPTRRPASTTRQ